MERSSVEKVKRRRNFQAVGESTRFFSKPCVANIAIAAVVRKGHCLKGDLDGALQVFQTSLGKAERQIERVALAAVLAFHMFINSSPFFCTIMYGCMRTCLLAYLSTFLPTTCLPICLSTHLPACLPIYLPTYIPTYLQTCIPTQLHGYVATVHTNILTCLHT